MVHPGQAMDLTAAYLRVASSAVGLYEYIITLPAEYRLYRDAWKARRLSIQCLLFFSIRYLSIVVIVLNDVGFFGTFSSSECRRFFLVAPTAKVFQSLASQLILATRTFSISQRARWVCYTLVVALTITVSMEFFSTIYKRGPVQSSKNKYTTSRLFQFPSLTEDKSCTSGNSTTAQFAWIYYVMCMVFDLVVIGISTTYLYRYSRDTLRMSHFIRRLLYEGIGYFVLLTGVNILNMTLFRSPSEAIQSSGVSLGYVITWITSQRLLLSHRYAAQVYTSQTAKSADCTTPVPKVFSVVRSLDTSHDINEALRSQFEASKAQKSFGHQAMILENSDSESSPTGTPSTPAGSQSLVMQETSELPVQVRVEQTVEIRYERHFYGMEDYRTHRTTSGWEDT